MRPDDLTFAKFEIRHGLPRFGEYGFLGSDQTKITRKIGDLGFVGFCIDTRVQGDLNDLRNLV